MNLLSNFFLFIGLTLNPLPALAFDSELDSTTPDINTYSIGYRMGLLNKYSVKGFPRSGEGELMLGSASSEAIESVECENKNQTGCTKSINPWKFSCNQDDGDVSALLDAAQGHYVVIKYRQVIVNGVGWAKFYDTDYRAIDVAPVNQSLEPAACHAGSGWGLKSNGQRSGRLVKLSLKGNTPATKGYEAIVQEGNAGNHFISMSVPNEKMAACMYKWLISGRYMRLTYNQSYVNLTPMFHDTTYQVTDIEPVSADALTR